MRILLSLLFIFISNILIAQSNTVVIDSNQNVIFLNKNIQFYEDKNKVLNIEQIKTANFQQNFKSFPREILNFGATTSAFWLKIKLLVQSNKQYYLQIDNPYLDSLFVYYPDKNNIYQYKLTGKNLPIETESIPSTHSIIELPIQKSSNVQTVYLRVSSSHFLHIPVKLIAKDNIIPLLLDRYMLELIYFGVIILAVFYNLFVYISVRDITYLYYVLYTFLIGLNIFNTRGYLSLFFAEHRDFISQYTYLSFFLSLPLIVLFTIHFLKVKQYSYFLYVVLKIFMYIFCALTLLVFLGYGGFAFKVILGFSTFNYIISLMIAMFIYYRGYEAAKYYLLSWGIFIVLTIYSLLAYMNIIDFHGYTKYITPTGIALETILSSLALANRINILKKENSKIQKRNINLVREKNEDLERQVRERTNEFEEKNQEIEIQNEELNFQQIKLKNSNENLEEKNQEIEAQNEELNLQKEELVKINETLKDSYDKLEKSDILIKEQNAELAQKQVKMITQNEKLFQQKKELVKIHETLKESYQKLEESDAFIKEQNAELAQKQVKMIVQNEKLYRQKKEIEALKDCLEEIVIERTQELSNALDNLTKQNQDLSQFSFIISHNLRAPVARILGLINIFNERYYDDEFNKKIIGHLKQTTVDLDIIIKDLTQIISIRNDLDKTKEEIDILNVIASEKILLHDEIEKTNAIIDVEFVTYNKLYTIKSYVHSIIHNLVSNAIKYKSTKRSPVIIIKAELVDDFICLSVQDNGLGIDLKNTDTYKIFGLYQRMHDHVEGKGMGLFLVKTQIESLKGKIEIESQLNVGTIFKVYFPI